MTTLQNLFDPDRSPILLDGATGTELERRGFALNRSGWSARAIDEAPELLESIHRDYVDAGAHIITANTFRLHRRNLATWGRADDQRRMVNGAIALARKAAAGRSLVAASLAPLGDCYSPDEVPDIPRLEREHHELATELARAGADLILIETMVAGVETLAAAHAAASTGLPFIVSFVTGPAGRLLSGENLSDALPQLLTHKPAAVGINCVTARHAEETLPTLLKTAGPTPCGIYANTGERAPDGSWRVTTASEPAVYAGLVQSWMSRGVKLIGGCCGTTPAHIAAMQKLIASKLP